MCGKACGVAASCGRLCGTDPADSAVRRALDRLDADGAHAAIERRTGRAPRVAQAPSALSGAVSISLSHTDGAVVAAAATGWDVGVDVEPADRVARGEVRYFLGGGERTGLAWHDATTLWCLKEAAWKALRCGPHVPFKAVQLRFDRSGRVVAVVLAGQRMPARARVRRLQRGSRTWVVAVVRVRGGHVRAGERAA
jgi:4'-phosphopantetheinyl transferase EntD